MNLSDKLQTQLGCAKNELWEHMESEEGIVLTRSEDSAYQPEAKADHIAF